MQTPYRTSLSITIVKTPFLSSLLISLYYKSVKEAFYIRTDISTYGDCFANISAEISVEVFTEVR